MHTYTLENLPESGMLYAFVTGERHTPESLEFGNAEEHGWVDWYWSPTMLLDSRNDVAPLIEYDVNDIRHGIEYAPNVTDSPEDIRGEIVRLIQCVIGYADSSDRGTIYAADSVIHDYGSNDTFTYAVHVFVKHLADGKYVESPVHIPADLINS